MYEDIKTLLDLKNFLNKLSEDQLKQNACIGNNENDKVINIYHACITDEDEFLGHNIYLPVSIYDPKCDPPFDKCKIRKAGYIYITTDIVDFPTWEPTTRDED